MRIERQFEKRGPLYVPRYVAPTYRGPRWCPYRPGQKGHPGFKFGTGWSFNQYNVASKRSSGLGSISCTYSGAVASGALLVCYLNWDLFGGAVTASVLDSINGGWTPGVVNQSGSNDPYEGAQIFSFPGSASGTPTVTASLSPAPSSFVFISIVEYRGGANGAMDGSSSANVSASGSVGSFSTTGSNDLIVFVASAGQSISQSNAGYTNEFTPLSNNADGFYADNTAASSGSQNPSFSITGSGYGAVVLAQAFLSQSAGTNYTKNLSASMALPS